MPAEAAIQVPSRHGPAHATSPFSHRQPHQTGYYSPNAEIYAQGDRTGAIYQVEFGAVRIYRLLADGRRQISAFHVAGEVFGLEADGRHHFFAEAICSSAVRVYRPPLATDASHDVLSIALKALVRAQEHLLVLGRQNAAERVAAFLLDMMERQGDLPVVELAMSRTDIGDYLGLTIETVSRVFSRFRDSGYLRLPSARTVEIVRAGSLRNMCV